MKVNNIGSLLSLIVTPVNVISSFHVGLSLDEWKHTKGTIYTSSWAVGALGDATDCRTRLRHVRVCFSFASPAFDGVEVNIRYVHGFHSYV